MLDVQLGECTEHRGERAEIGRFCTSRLAYGTKKTSPKRPYSPSDVPVLSLATLAVVEKGEKGGEVAVVPESEATDLGAMCIM